MGVVITTETVWRQADKYGVPRICFITKSTKPVVTSINHSTRFMPAAPRRFPDPLANLVLNKVINGIVDPLAMKAYTL